MSKVARGARFALLVVLLSVLVTGCAGAAANPGWTVVTADADVVYSILPTGKLIALDAHRGGEPLWSYPVADQAGGSPFAIFQRPTDDNQIRTLNAVYGDPVLSADRLVFGSYDGHLYAFERGGPESVGRLAWRFPLEGAIGPVIGGPAIYDGTVYFGSSDHGIYAVDLDTGEAVWTEPFKGENWIWGTPVVDDERVYVGSMDHHVYVLDRLTGQLVWDVDLGGSVPGSVTLADGLLLAGGVDKRLHALDVDDGSERWVTDSLEGWIWGRPVVEDGFVYVGTLNGQVHSFALSDGAAKWEPITLEGALRAGPALLDGYLFVGTEEQIVYRINTDTGASKKFFQATGALLSNPVIVDTMIYVGSSAGRVYALDASREVDPLVWVYPPAKD